MTRHILSPSHVREPGISPSEYPRCPAPDGVQKCRTCGCWDLDACWNDDLGPCWWVESDLCSHCALKSGVLTKSSQAGDSIPLPPSCPNCLIGFLVDPGGTDTGARCMFEVNAGIDGSVLQQGCGYRHEE